MKGATHKTMKIVYTIILLILTGLFPLMSQTPIAFPGAEGHGRYATGGRGGSVYYVTTLDDNGSTSLTGSLRWALNQASPKTILFKVAGTITLKTDLKISKGDVTIAGQSAPGDGICIAGFPVTVSANNVVIRYLRFRMGDGLDTNADGADALGAREYKNIIIDHCSVSWSTDECLSFYGNENTTIQWCIISESLRLSGHSKGPHGYGGIWGGKNASFHHNLMAHHDSRTPRFGPYVKTKGNEYVDMRNNVIYNWSGNGCYGGEAMHINIINNCYKPGPASPSGSKRGRITTIDRKTGLASGDDFFNINNVWGQYYVSGNLVDASASTGTDITHCNNATNDNWTYGVMNQFAMAITTKEKEALKMTAPFDPSVVTTHSAADAYTKVLAHAGASLVRDAHDQRIVNETANGTAAFKGLSPYNGLGSVTYPAGTVIGSTTLTVATTINWKSVDYPKWGIIDSQNDIKPDGAAANWSPWPTLSGTWSITDADNDGMPDNWESANGVTDKNGHDLDANFTNLEVYLNSLVASITTTQNADALYVTDVNDAPNAIADHWATYLNPATMMLHVESAQTMQGFEIINQSGVTIHRQTVEGTTASHDAGALQRGVYYIRASFADGATATKKILKTR